MRLQTTGTGAILYKRLQSRKRAMLLTALDDDCCVTVCVPRTRRTMKMNAMTRHQTMSCPRIHKLCMPCPYLSEPSTILPLTWLNKTMLHQASLLDFNELSQQAPTTPSLARSHLHWHVRPAALSWCGPNLVECASVNEVL